MNPIVTGLMAYGMSGRLFHAPFLASNTAFRFKAVLERGQKKATQHYPDVISYSSVEALLNDPEIELIVVNSPNHTHFDLAKSALKAGKHVLIEKPAAIHVAEAKTLFELGKKLDLKVLVYQNRRYDSSFLSFKKVLESGCLGKLLEVHLRLDRYRMAIGAKPFKENPEIPGNGLLYDIGPHLLDHAIELFGKPVEFHKTTAKHRPATRVDDYFHLHLVYPEGLNVYLSSAMLIADPQPAFVAHGSLGSFVKMSADVQQAQLDAGMMPSDAVFGLEPAGSEGKLVQMGLGQEKNTTWVPAEKGDYNALFNAVYQTIRNDTLFPVKEEEILLQLRLLDSENT
ncbi:Gfo/Idh/MocA family oxidoreductase [Pedobacter nutrimenti]|uniref:Putative dehydrogenase n=1 Tax=Pedobacter nutrimenti TaxID=1241337 RepID=A0A318UDT3_9SPHI|nr:Gfo/Idh/MocA family oxidoreductase [Pedobacter nutrimenti]PYF72819.1 putative dehydrogenase [Pedobacter nutrimenti]